MTETSKTEASPAVTKESEQKDDKAETQGPESKPAEQSNSDKK